MAINPNLPSRCEDWPCCGHTDGLPCDWVPDYEEIHRHAGCDHEAGYCQHEVDEDDLDEDNQDEIDYEQFRYDTGPYMDYDRE